MISPFQRAEPTEKPSEMLIKCLLIEYNYLEKISPLGVYITMEENNILQWNGNLIIKDGVYQNMFTTFKIMIPLTYPTEHPNVFFAPGIVHPLIDQVNGEFDIKKLFPTWIPGQNFILQLIFAIRDIFLNPDYFKVEDSFNGECGRIFNTSYGQFEDNIRKNVKNLRKSKLIDNNQIIDEEGGDYYQSVGAEEIKDEFKKILNRSDIQAQEKKDLIKKWFLNTFVAKKTSEIDN